MLVSSSSPPNLSLIGPLKTDGDLLSNRNHWKHRDTHRQTYTQTQRLILILSPYRISHVSGRVTTQTMSMMKVIMLCGLHSSMQYFQWDL